MEEIHKLKTFTALDCISSVFYKKYDRDLLKEEIKENITERFRARDLCCAEKSWEMISLSG